MNSPREVIKKGSKSFALASLFLPQAKQNDVYLLYAWLRHCDDVIDRSESQFTDLDNLQTQTFGENPSPQFAGIQLLLKKRNVPSYYVHEFFKGLKMDLDHQGFERLEDLELYCYRVAGVVGLMMCPLIGVTHPQALRNACSLGLAMQLTNICRDVLEDAKNGRVYLPQSFSKNPITTSEILQSPAEVYNVVLKLLDRAELFYEQGNKGLKYLPLRVAIAIGCASHFYKQIGIQLRQLGPAGLKSRTVVSGFQKCVCVLKGFALALWSRLSPVKAEPMERASTLPLFHRQDIGL